MKIIVCGSGPTGVAICKYLSEEAHEIVLIDSDKELLSDMNMTMDIRTIVGNASYPDVLQKAGADRADILIAVTDDDALNMMICQMAKTVFHVPLKIARLRCKEYGKPAFQKSLPADILISPEDEIVSSILYNLKVSGALEVVPLANSKVSFLGMLCAQGAALDGISLKSLFQKYGDSFIKMIKIIRAGAELPLQPETKIQSGDEVYFMTSGKTVEKAVRLFQPESFRMRRLMIFGAGSIGFPLALRLEAEKYPYQVTLIEKDVRRAKEISEKLSNTLVFGGGAFNMNLLNEAQIQNTDVSIALTSDDEHNILMSIVAKKNGVKRTYTLLGKSDYDSFVRELGTDVVIDASSVAVSTVLRHIHKQEVKTAYSLQSNIGEIIVASVTAQSKSVGKKALEMKINGGLLCCLFRKGKLMKLTKKTVIKEKDDLVLFLNTGFDRQIEKIF